MELADWLKLLQNLLTLLVVLNGLGKRFIELVRLIREVARNRKHRAK